MFWVAFVYGAGGSLGAATGILLMLAGMAVLDTITGKAERQLKDLEQSKATSVEMLAALLARNEIGRQQVAALEKLCERGPCVFHNDDE